MMINRKVLLIENNHSHPAVVSINGQLDKAGYQVTRCSTAEFGWSTLQLHEATGEPFMFCIVDAQVQRETDVLHFTKKVREITPHIINTLINYNAEPVAALQAGVDIIIEQPFTMEELFWRMGRFEKLLIHAERKSSSDTLAIGNLLLQNGTLLHQDGGVVIKLTPKQGQLLTFLYKHANRLVERKYVLMELWGTRSYHAGRSMDVMICNLRKCFKDNPAVVLQTLHGIGFCLIIGEQ